MKAIRRRTLWAIVVLQAALGAQGCAPGPLPKPGVTHAVAGLDRALIAAAFVNEAANEYQEPELGFFDAEDLEFLHAYLDSCTTADFLGEELDSWPDPSIQVAECIPGESFVLGIMSKDITHYQVATVAVSRAAASDPANKAVRTHAQIVGPLRDGPPLGVGTIYDLTTEFTAAPELVKRVFGEATHVVFDWRIGGTQIVSYGSGTGLEWNALECPAGSGPKVAFSAEVSGGLSGLPPATVGFHGADYRCMPADFEGGPPPGDYDVTAPGPYGDVTTTVYFGMGEDGVEFRGSNTIGAEAVEVYCSVVPSEGMPGITEGYLSVNGERIVDPASGEGRMSLSISFPAGTTPQTFLGFETFMDETAIPPVLASEQEEPTLLGLLLMMGVMDDGSDWCDEDDDWDGISNCSDPCSNDPDPGCGNDWCAGDNDADGMLNCSDPCPDDPNPACGTWCGGDEDGDGILNCEDPCLANSANNCFCAGDLDGDETLNCQDLCPDDPADACWCAEDGDGDGRTNCQDHCPADATNLCEPWCYYDEDGDGQLNCADDCANDPGC
ncbi:MAG: hypothetical protein AB1640_12795 [bacterium]